MSTFIYHHPSCLKHDPGPDRAFAPARLQTICDSLKEQKGLVWREAAPVARDYLSLLHTPDYIEAVLSPIAEGEEKAFDFETVAVTGTAEATLQAAGLVWQAVQDVVKNKGEKAFCLVSPGGHHAEADMSLGFCFFNHVALAGVAAQKFLGLGRIAVLDFDAHHGNGTQSFFWNFEDRLYVSLHEESPLSGFADEHGAWDNVLNLPLPTGSGGDVFRRILMERALPKIAAFAPDLLLVSAGFDMHKQDPLAGLCLEEKDYRDLGTSVRDLAKTSCQGRVVAVLEGGYNLDHLAPSVAAFVEGFEDI